jgi:peroxiredoxin
MKRASLLPVALALCVAGATTVAAAPEQSTPKKPASPKSGTAIGPAVGARIAMAMPLTASTGKATTLGAVAGDRPVMIVLFRSAKWCPYCQAQLKGLGPVAAAARTKGVRFIAVSYDAPDVLAGFAAKQNIGFPLFSDPGSRMIDTLRLRDPQYARDSFAYGVPYPTTLLVDAGGTVRGKVVETNYKIRPAQRDLIAMLDRI